MDYTAVKINLEVDVMLSSSAVHCHLLALESLLADEGEKKNEDMHTFHKSIHHHCASKKNASFQDLSLYVC